MKETCDDEVGCGGILNEYYLKEEDYFMRNTKVSIFYRGMTPLEDLVSVVCYDN